MMNQDVPGDEVLIEAREGLGIIALNRPHVLNALSLEMIRTIASALHRWESDSSIQGVLFQGAGDKAFCAGGDVKSFYQAGMDCRKGLVSPRVPVVFFAEEYSLNKQIFHYPKPTFAEMDGITMGGGYGIAGHCDIRIAGPKTVFAMPEVRIGFFPDVGSLYQLNQCPHRYGRYLALTGNNIDGKVAVSVGLADFYLEDMNEIAGVAVNALQSGDFKAAITNALDGGEAERGAPAHVDVIKEAFCDCNLSSIIERLEKSGSSFARDTLDILRSRSPLSLAVTARHLELAQDASFDEIISTDFVLAQHFIRQSDMYEGIRAQIIDKDRTPGWYPSSFEELEEKDVNLYFTPTGYDLRDVRVF